MTTEQSATERLAEIRKRHTALPDRGGSEDIAWLLAEVDRLRALQRRMYDGEKAAGWDPDDTNTFSEEVTHLHEEISEAFRAWRKHKNYGVYWMCQRCSRAVPHDTDLDTIRHAGSGHHYTSRGDDNTVDNGGFDCHGKFKPEGVPVELADAMIGMFYMAERFGFDLLAAIETKHAYNLRRSYAAEDRRLHEPQELREEES